MVEQLRQDLVNLLIEKNRLDALRKGYSEVIKRVSKRLKELPGIKTGWNHLNEDVERHKKTYEQLKINLEEAEMQRTRQMQFVIVVDSAKSPDNPSFPKLWLNVIVALMCGTIVGVFYSFFINYIEEAGKMRTTKIIKEILSEE